MKKLWLATTAFFVLCALALVGCSSSAQTSAPSSTTSDTSSTTPEKKGEIAFFSVSGQIPIITTLADSVTKYLGSKGYHVTVYDAKFDAVTQAQQISQAIATHSIAAAWVFPVAAEALSPSLDALKSAGVPVVLEADPKSFGFSDAQSGIVFDSASFTDYGSKIAELANTCAKSKGASKTMLLEASAVAGGAADVHASVIKDYTGGSIVASAQAQDVASAQTTTTDLLNAHPDVDVVIAASDETALGAVAAFQAAGKKPKCLVAGGGGPDTMAALKAGDITSVVAWDYSASSQAAGDNLLELIKSPTKTGSIFKTAIKVTEQNKS
ncbi:MAG: sugar ABC transporter substrate-binding protein [Acidobacteria bacterium]|nr:sugar ABC transporter substrate-binding protein [Acidobacteriota bacterium]